MEIAGPPQGFGNGIWFKSDSSQPSGGGHYIADNVIVGGFDGIGGETENDVHGSFDRNTIIEGNVISDCWDDGIQVEGGNADIRVRYNRIDGCAIGIAFAPNLQGPLYIEKNKILDMQPGYYGDATAFKIGGGTPTAVAYLTDNTAVSGGDGIKQSEPGLAKLIARHNVFQLSGYVLATTEPLAAGSSFDENCFVMPSTPIGFVRVDQKWYPDLRSFTAATGQDKNSRQSADCS
jgi:hypothetical protein